VGVQDRNADVAVEALGPPPPAGGGGGPPPRRPHRRHQRRYATLLGRLGPALDGPGTLADANAWYFILEGTREP
jgi:hypothetical protein